ncbi:hypothetical protein BKA70DRAFT_1228467 [Coprinopsis sp. MPI-PUGE-AT-0042]|nr:hypothetical protein BKA70DRAFT_1228467 [Coprinopsis sp. MPI-PUGE-AT-0042]
MDKLLGFRSTHKAPVVPASYRGPYRDKPDPMFQDEAPESQLHLFKSASANHSYPPQPSLTPDAPPKTHISAESPSSGSSLCEPPASQALAPIGSRVLMSASVGQTKRSNETPEDDRTEGDHSVGVKVRLVAQNDRQQAEAMQKQEDSIAMILRRLEGLQTEVIDQGKMLGETRQELRNTQQELADTRKALEENREQLAIQTAALEECRAELAQALEAQKVSEGVIRELKEEVERKTREIDELKRDIQEKDEQMARLADENRARVKEVSRHADERLERIGNDARRRMEEDQAALADAQRRMGELEATARRVEEAEAAKKTAEAEMARQQAEEMEVEAQVQVEDEDRMQTDDDGMVTKNAVAALPAIPPPRHNVTHQRVVPPPTPSAAHRAQSESPSRRGSTVPPPLRFTHSKSGSGPRYVLGPTPSPRLLSPQPTVNPENSRCGSPTPNPPRKLFTRASSIGGIPQDPVSEHNKARDETMIPLSAIPAILAEMHQCPASPPPTPPRERQPKPLYHQRVVRTAPKEKAWKNIVYDVRIHMNSLLRIAKDLDLVRSDAALEDEQMMKAFEDGESDDGPVLDPMRPAWKVLNCRWNKRLGELFVDYMICEVGKGEDERVDLMRAFEARLVRLRAILMANKRKENETDDAWRRRVEDGAVKDAKRKRSNARRSTLFDKRQEIAGELRDDKAEDAAWREIDEVVGVLGVGGMSSDESEYEDDGSRKTRTVRVRSMPWRAEEICSLMKVIDQDEMKVNSAGRQKAGNPGMKRIRPRYAPSTTRDAVPGLPVNYYDPTWLEGLSREETKELRALPGKPLPNLMFG